MTLWNWIWGRSSPPLRGPKRPQDRVALRQAKIFFHESCRRNDGEGKSPFGITAIRFGPFQRLSGPSQPITSCTNTSKPLADAGEGGLGLGEGKAVRGAGLRREALGENQPRSWFESGDGLPAGPQD